MPLARDLRGILSLDRRLIGEPLARPGWRAAIAVTVGLLTLGLDFWILWRVGGPWELRALPPMLALLVYLRLGRGDRRAAGLRLVPEPGWRYWAGMLGVTLMVVALAVAVAVPYAYFQIHTQRGVAMYLLNPAHFWPAFVTACVMAPLVEEATFRLALCTPLTPVIGPWPTVLFSGAAFAAIHFVYGNAHLSNFFAGYCLTWAYLKSGSILVPIVLHSLGNLLILCAQMAAWVWFRGG